MILSKCMHSLNGLKSSFHISMIRNASKIRNSPYSGTVKLIEQKISNSFAKKPKTVFLISLTPLLPVIYAKELKSVETQIQKTVDSFELDETVDKDVKDEIKEDNKQNYFTWSEFWNMILPNYASFIIAILSSLAIAYLNIKIPICLGELTNAISRYVNTEFDSKEFFNSIKKPALNLIWSYLLQGAFTSITITALSNLGENVAATLKMRLFKSIINQDVEFFDRRQSGEIMSVLNELQEFKSSFKTFFAQGLRSFTQTIGCAINLYVISPKMCGFLCIVVPNIVLVGSFIGRCLREMSRRCQEQAAKCSAIANECICSIRLIKQLAIEERQAEAYDNEVHKLKELNQNLGYGIALFQGLTNLALNGIVLSCMLVGGHLMSRNEITPGDLFSFLVASQTIQRSLASLSLMSGHYIKYVNSGNRIFEFINMNPQLTSIVNLKLTPLIGEINFRKVNFSYPSRKNQKVFDNFNLRINPGQTVGIVGHSGSGKSTIAMLLERFYDVDSGSVNIDGINIKNLDLTWLRKSQIGYINQEPTLFATTILNNIKFGNPNATDDQVFQAAKLANAHDFIESFPDSYQTMVGERGINLSGGQKQRICIAREILKNPSILILDEATSSLDSQSEKLINDALDKLKRGRTTLIIAHRLSTVKNAADLIIVMSEGKIREIGTHDELVRSEGLYYQLIRQQFN